MRQIYVYYIPVFYKTTNKIPVFPIYLNTRILLNMDENTRFSIKVPVFRGRTLPEPGSIVGYAAIIDGLGFPVPVPDTVSMISEKNKKYRLRGWQVFTPGCPRYATYRGSFIFSEEGVLENVFKYLSINYQNFLFLVNPVVANSY